jgi:hypothetical protein
VGGQEMKNPSSFSKVQPMTIKSMQKQRKTIIHPGGIKKKVPELNL